MRLRSAIALACATGILAAGCARQAALTDLPSGFSRAGQVTLEVTNNSWQDVVVYVMRGGQRSRIMTVVATNTASSALRPELLGPGGELRVLAYPVGGHPRYVSPRVYASPGTTVSLNLEVDLRRSNVAVW